MDEELREKLVSLVQQCETVNGREVEGLVRPTTDRTKLEALARIVAGILAVLLQLISPPADGSGKTE